MKTPERNQPNFDLPSNNNHQELESLNLAKNKHGQKQPRD
jgi:hypothetical protein